MRIYLVGFMGSGKSYWGKLWAKEKGFLFIDTDECIEKTEGQSIEMIFEKKGETYFRQLESSVLRSTLEYNDCIIACGGGTPCFDDNMNWMNSNGTTIFLQSTASQLLQNILLETHKRPLIKNIDHHELLNYIEQKLSDRIDIYKMASIIVDIHELDEKYIGNIILHQTINNA